MCLVEAVLPSWEGRERSGCGDQEVCAETVVCVDGV